MAPPPKARKIKSGDSDLGEGESVMFFSVNPISMAFILIVAIFVPLSGVVIATMELFSYVMYMDHWDSPKKSDQKWDKYVWTVVYYNNVQGWSTVHVIVGNDRPSLHIIVL